jgi:hypothetical protein
MIFRSQKFRLFARADNFAIILNNSDKNSVQPQPYRVHSGRISLVGYHVKAGWNMQSSFVPISAPAMMPSRTGLSRIVYFLQLEYCFD